jgi:hypothetical protein
VKCHSEPCPEINSGSSSESLRGRLVSASNKPDPEIVDPDPEPRRMTLLVSGVTI